MSESREIDSKHGIRRKNWPFWQCCWGRALRPTIATAEPDGRAQGSIGSRSSPIGQIRQNPPEIGNPPEIFFARQTTFKSARIVEIWRRKPPSGNAATAALNIQGVYFSESCLRLQN
jgi:hypothetical protein